jgi:hypothetical protein
MFSIFKIPQEILKATECKTVDSKFFGHKNTNATSIKGHEKSCRSRKGEEIKQKG